MEWLTRLQGASCGATFFFTNDLRLPTIPNLEIIVLDAIV